MTKLLNALIGVLLSYSRTVILVALHFVILRVSASVDDYIDFGDMGNYDHNVQRNIDKKMSDFGMVPDTARESSALMATPKDNPDICDPGCIRSMEYLQRIVKSLLRQMNVHSHIFGPGEAITIDLQAELKYDDYVTLTKFMKSTQKSEEYLYRIDKIMSNLIHVVDHSSSRFDFLENIIHLPAFLSLKFWIILLTFMVIGSLIVVLFVKAVNTRTVHNQLLYGFLIIFIVSCVWTFSSLYEDKKAEIHAQKVQSNGRPPKDCDFEKMSMWDNIKYVFRVDFFGNKDHCRKYYAMTMTDPFWKINPMEAISSSVAFFMFKPLSYIGENLGSFFMNFVASAPPLMKPFMLVVALIMAILPVLALLMLCAPFRISTPLLTIEPVYRQNVPALERHSILQHMQAMIGHERVTRNEIMERPDGPVVKSVRDATTDMDGFQDYLSNEGTDEIEIIGPFARFNLEEKSSNNSPPAARNSMPSPSVESLLTKRDIKISSSDDIVSSIPVSPTKHGKCDPKLEDQREVGVSTKMETNVPVAGVGDITSKIVLTELVECMAIPGSSIKLIKEDLLRDALREDLIEDVLKDSPENILP